MITLYFLQSRVPSWVEFPKNSLLFPSFSGIWAGAGLGPDWQHSHPVRSKTGLAAFQEIPSISRGLGRGLTCLEQERNEMSVTGDGLEIYIPNFRGKSLWTGRISWGHVACPEPRSIRDQCPVGFHVAVRHVRALSPYARINFALLASSSIWSPRRMVGATPSRPIFK